MTLEEANGLVMAGHIAVSEGGVATGAEDVTGSINRSVRWGGANGAKRRGKGACGCPVRFSNGRGTRCCPKGACPNLENIPNKGPRAGFPEVVVINRQRDGIGGQNATVQFVSLLFNQACSELWNRVENMCLDGGRQIRDKPRGCGNEGFILVGVRGGKARPSREGSQILCVDIIEYVVTRTGGG